MSLKEKLKHAVFTDDEKPVAPPAAAPKASSVAPVAPTVPNFGFAAGAPSGVSSPSVVADNSNIYETLKSKTDFDTTQAGQVLQKYLHPLEKLPMDPAMKIKTAVAQAAGNDGLDANKILLAFEGLKAALQNESDRFSQAAQEQTDKLVTTPTNRIQEITNQIQKLQAEQSQLSSDLIAAQGKIANMSQQFQMAANRRAMEIDQQKAQYASMLN